MEMVFPPVVRGPGAGGDTAATGGPSEGVRGAWGAEAYQRPACADHVPGGFTAVPTTGRAANCD